MNQFSYNDHKCFVYILLNFFLLFRPLFPLAHWSLLLRRTYRLISLQKQEDRRRREEYSLGADLEDVVDLRQDQRGGGARLAQL